MIARDGPLRAKQGEPRIEHGLNTDKFIEAMKAELNMIDLDHHEITEHVIGAAFEVYRVLGYGFLERVYQRAIQVELSRRGLKAELESRIKVVYKGAVVGDYQADLFVEECVLVELKVAKTYNHEDEPQLLNELKATGIKVGLLINIGRTKVEFRRFVF